MLVKQKSEYCPKKEHCWEAMPTFDVGERFKTLRIAAGYETSKHFALENEIGESDVRAFENNQNEPTIRRILKFISPLGVTLAEFFEGADRVPPKLKGRVRENLQIGEHEEPWIEMLIQILKSSDRIAITAVQNNLLCFEEKVRDREAVEKARAGPKRVESRSHSRVAEKSPAWKGAKKESR